MAGGVLRAAGCTAGCDATPNMSMDVEPPAKPEGLNSDDAPRPQEGPVEFAGKSELGGSEMFMDKA